MSKQIGILTAGGDSPGLNAAMRGLGKAAIRTHGMTVIGFRDGFRGLMQNRFIRLESSELSGILTAGGTLLGTSRDKPHKMDVGGKTLDMTDLMLENIAAHQLDALVCIGGGGTAKNAMHLAEKGVPVLTLPKTIDNDLAHTDTTLGFDTAMGIATEAIDRLHSTAHSHHRIVVVEVMGHNTGWIALGAGLAGGGDVILIPEIPYQTHAIADAILERRASGSSFSIVVISEGAISQEIAAARDRARIDKKSEDSEVKEKAKETLSRINEDSENHTATLSKDLEARTGLESRVTILGHVQRGGTPSPADRLLATRLGTACADFIAAGESGVMVAMQNGECVPVPLDQVAGNRKTVPLDHPWLLTARNLRISLGDDQVA
jgi:ATP-dependent phosphofructokinase / diphosphate-dependent phosphofructokinase